MAIIENMKNDNLLISPSILAADFSDIVTALDEIRESGTDYVHVDVMDGMFVPNISFGPKFVKDMRKHSDLIFDVHLMIEEPERYIKQFADAGSDIITIHHEATRHTHKAISEIKALGLEAGIAINPGTSVSSISAILPFVDYVLVMSVNPGFGGQSFIEESANKVAELCELRDNEGYNYLINIDGGISEKTIKSVASAGVDMIVAGSAFFSSPDKKGFVENMKRLAEEAR